VILISVWLITRSPAPPRQEARAPELLVVSRAPD
jgi:hypothetical protein